MHEAQAVGLVTVPFNNKKLDPSLSFLGTKGNELETQPSGKRLVAARLVMRYGNANLADMSGSMR